MDPARRKELTRYGAPAAFLVAVTILVLLIKSGLSGGSSQPTVTGTLEPTITTTATATTTAQTTTATTTATTTTAARFYTIQPGDTFGAIAAKENTTVDQLLRLNPGVDPKALHAGQRIRVN